MRGAAGAPHLVRREMAGVRFLFQHFRKRFHGRLARRPWEAIETLSCRHNQDALPFLRQTEVQRVQHAVIDMITEGLQVARYALDNLSSAQGDQLLDIL